jgi:hypothetical protein
VRNGEILRKWRLRAIAATSATVASDRSALQQRVIRPGEIQELTNVSGDELGHLEHTNLALAVKYRLEMLVGVNLGSLFLVLKAVLLDVIPKLLGQLRAREGLRADNR